MSAKQQPHNFGSYAWRGDDEPIELEKIDDRYTALVTNEDHLRRLQSAPGVREVYLLGAGVARIITTARERDGSMAAVRSWNTVAHHAYKPKGSEGTMFYITDKILARFRDKPDNGAVGNILNKYALGVVHRYEDERTFLLQVTTPSGANPVKIAHRLKIERAILWAEPNMLNRFRPAGRPTDQYFPQQWHLEFNGAEDVVPEACLGMVSAWDFLRDNAGRNREYGDRKIVIAIIDDGFELEHPDFDQKRISHKKDFVDGDRNPEPQRTGHRGSLWGDFHGTSCAGVALARVNGSGVVGVAPNCTFMPVRMPMSVDDHKLDKVLNWVAKYADVISCSFAPPPVDAPHARKLKETLDEITTAKGRDGKGCVVCIAAGNHNAPIKRKVRHFRWIDEDGTPRTTSGPILHAMAAHPDVIAVSACNSKAAHAEYSNWGKEISVCAPSSNSRPGSTAGGKLPLPGIVTTDNEKKEVGFTPGLEYTTVFGGTSAAAPMVAGIAALVLSANPDLTASEIKQILQDTAVKIPTNNGGAPNSRQKDYQRGIYHRGRCDWFGYGRVDALGAIREAFQRRSNRRSMSVSQGGYL